MKFIKILKNMCLLLFFVILPNIINGNEADLKKINDFDKHYVDKYIKFYQPNKIDSSKISNSEGYKKLIKYILSKEYHQNNFIRIVNIFNYPLIYTNKNGNFFNYDVCFIFQLKKDAIKLVFLRGEKIIDSNLTIQNNSGDYFVIKPIFTNNTFKSISKSIFQRYSDFPRNHICINVRIDNNYYNLFLENFCYSENNYKAKVYQFYDNMQSDDILFFNALFQLIIYLENHRIFTDFIEKYY